MVKSFVTLQISSCAKCPFIEAQRTEGAGYALDYFCTKKRYKKIAGYVEWDSEFPKEIPEWCPLRNKNVK